MYGLDPTLLPKIVRNKMPFGKHEGWLLADLPVHYLEWFARKGFPKGELGMLLETVLVIKTNGLEEIIAELKKRKNQYPQ